MLLVTTAATGADRTQGREGEEGGGRREGRRKEGRDGDGGEEERDGVDICIRVDGYHYTCRPMEKQKLRGSREEKRKDRERKGERENEREIHTNRKI